MFNKNFLIENTKTLFYALIIAVIIRSLIIQPFYIPSSSMEPNLLVGDRLFVTKYSYGYSKHSFPFSPPIFSGRIFSADHVGIPKPAPDLYLYCAEQLNCTPQKCLVVEDSPRGAMAGVSAGMTVFGYSGTKNRTDLFSAGCSTVSSKMTDLLDFVGVHETQ